VNGYGCSKEQEETPNGDGTGASGTDAPEPQTGAVGTWTPEDDGKIGANGFATFVLDPDGAYPVVLRTLASNVTKRAGGFDLAGTVLMDVPGGEPVTLLEANVSLDNGSAEGAGLESCRGSVRLPFPNIGYLGESSVADPVYAEAGYDYGRNAKNVDVPLDDDRTYFFFTFSAGLEASVGELEVSCALNQSATMALDPSDPAFFLKASLGGLMGPVDEASIGFSIGGHLAFEPSATWGIDDEAASFEGHFWIGGQVNLNDVGLPLAVSGNTVYDFDPNDDGVSLFEQPEDGFRFGSNSGLDVSIDAKLIAFEIPVAEATVVGHAGDSGASAYYSGVVRAGNGWMPDEVPLKSTGELLIAGHASSHPEDDYFQAEGNATFDAGKLGEWTGLDLRDLAVAEARLVADADGVLVNGSVNTRFSPYLGLSGDVDAEAFFNGNPDDWYVWLDGRLEVSGIDLSSNASAVLDADGLFVEGVMTTPLSRIDMSGTIDEDGVDVRGHAEVTIPIVAGKEVVQWVTDAAVCGVETVTDAATCGTTIVNDAVRCGVEHVTSGAQCGYSTVKSGALCGYRTAQNAAECGTTYVTSGAQCGWDTITDIVRCGVCLFGGCSCQVARSCHVANTCTFENTCQVEASCDVPKSCEVAATCDRVKTCEQRVIVPDFDYGTFEGTVDVAIGTNGLEGSVAGEYCPTGGSCAPLGGGSVLVTKGGPEACVTVASLGEFCSKF
jgi:hypothetical protein